MANGVYLLGVVAIIIIRWIRYLNTMDTMDTMDTILISDMVYDPITHSCQLENGYILKFGYYYTCLGIQQEYWFVMP